MTARASEDVLARRETIGSVLVLSGYGLRIAVERGHLVLEDGIGDERRTLRFSRVSRDLKRLIVLGHAGTVTLDALQWLHDLGITLVHLGHDGEVITTSVPRTTDDVRVRRGQALSAVNGVGLAVAKTLLGLKIAGQERVALRLGAANAVRWLREAASLVREAVTPEEARFIESKAAAAYWDAWQEVAVHFTPADAKRVPAHWLSFDARRSVLSQSPRKAANPANAILNYLYAILEAEARIASLRVGIDPGMGVLHVDSTRRDAFVCDLMEAVRPDVDDYVYSLLASHTFRRSDFFETADGNCRLMPTMTKPLSQTATRWAKRLAPVAERLAGAFATPTPMVLDGLAKDRTAALPSKFRTPLTQANRSDAHARRLNARALADALEPSCRKCGADLGSLDRTFCDQCLDSQRADAAKLARTALATQRERGEDRRSSETARAKRRVATTKQMREIAAWNDDNSHATSSTGDVRHYERTVAPRLRDVPIRALTEATGLSVVYCRQLRRGEKIPHARHWDALRVLVEKQGASIPKAWNTAFYLREIAAKLDGFTPQQIAKASGLSVSYCKRLRRGKQVARRHHWQTLVKLVASG